MEILPQKYFKRYLEECWICNLFILVACLDFIENKKYLIIFCKIFYYYSFLEAVIENCTKYYEDPRRIEMWSHNHQVEFVR